MYHELKALRAGGAWRHTFRGNAEAVLLKNRDNLWEFYRKFTVDGGKRSCGGGGKEITIYQQPPACGKRSSRFVFSSFVGRHVYLLCGTEEERVNYPHSRSINFRAKAPAPTDGNLSGRGKLAIRSLIGAI